MLYESVQTSSNIYVAEYIQKLPGFQVSEHQAQSVLHVPMLLYASLLLTLMCVV